MLVRSTMIPNLQADVAHCQDQRLHSPNVGAASFYPELTDHQLTFPQSFAPVRFSSRTMWILTQGL